MTRVAHRRTARTAALAACLGMALLAPAAARAGYGVQPTGTIEAAADDTGRISRPSTIDLLVYLDSADSNPSVAVSTSPTWSILGSPTGSLDGFCTSFRAWSEPGKYSCAISTAGLRAGVTYYWWLGFDRLDPGARVPGFRVSGPFSFTLRAAPATPPAAAGPATAAAPTVARTKESAATLPAAARWTGSRSIVHTTVTDAITKTMKTIGMPRALAAACWTNDDFESVLEAEGETGSHGDSTVTGVWFRAQPRWLHLRGSECTDLQRLIDTKAATGKGAYGLSNALHETMHAYGTRNEAQTNCYAVQLVPYAAFNLGLPWTRAAYLGKLAVNYVRRTAPEGYWNAGSCRDGGAWDLERDRVNLG